MSYSISTTYRVFGPSEAATISGVSTTLQRDWRRRKLWPAIPTPGKHARYGLPDLIKLAVMRLFSDAGVDVSRTTIVAQMAVMPTLGAMALIDEAVVFEGAEIPDEDKIGIRRGVVKTSRPTHTPGRFLVLFGKGEYDVLRADDLCSMESALNKSADPILLIVDCHNLARRIVARAGGPVIRYEIEATGE